MNEKEEMKMPKKVENVRKITNEKLRKEINLS